MNKIKHTFKQYMPATQSLAKFSERKGILAFYFSLVSLFLVVITLATLINQGLLQSPLSYLTPASASSPFGGAVLLNPNDERTQYIHIPSSSSLVFPQNIKTVEARFKVKNFSTPYGYPSIIMRSVNPQNFQQPTWLLSISPRIMRYGGVTNSFGNFCYTEGISPIESGRWYHIAISKTDTGAKIYIDGNEVASSNCAEISPSWDSISGIGGDQMIVRNDTYENYTLFQGCIDEVRISKTTRYSSNFQPPSEPFSTDSDTVALYHLDGNADDTSSYQNHGQVMGGAQFDCEPVPTGTPSPTEMPSPTPIPSLTPTVVQTLTPTPTFIPSPTFTPTFTPTKTLTPTPTPTTGIVTGTIYSSTGGTIAGAKIFLTVNRVRRDYTSDSQGKYIIPDLPPGNYTITYVASGYSQQKTDVTIKAGQTLIINVSLNKKK